MSGLFSGAAMFLDLDGLIQYRSNIPSLSQLLRDLFSDSAKTPLQLPLASGLQECITETLPLRYRLVFFAR